MELVTFIFYIFIYRYSVHLSEQQTEYIICKAKFQTIIDKYGTGIHCTFTFESIIDVTFANSKLSKIWF